MSKSKNLPSKLSESSVFAEAYQVPSIGQAPAAQRLATSNKVCMVKDDFSQTPSRFQQVPENSPIVKMTEEFIEKEYQKFLDLAKDAGVKFSFDTNKISKKDFLDLITDPISGTWRAETLKEARTAIQGYVEGYYEKPYRIPKEIFKQVPLDYRTNGPAPYTHVDPKGLVGLGILRGQGQDVSLEQMATAAGERISEQKHK